MWSWSTFSAASGAANRPSADASREPQLAYLAAPAVAQRSPGFDVERLAPISQRIGGVWGAEDVRTDAEGRSFVPVKEYRWSADGVAIAFRQYNLYEDGSTRAGIEGQTVWDPAAQTIRAFGVFASGGIIYDATYDPHTLATDTTVMTFRFASPTDGTVSICGGASRFISTIAPTAKKGICYGTGRCS